MHSGMYEVVDFIMLSVLVVFIYLALSYFNLLCYTSFCVFVDSIMQSCVLTLMFAQCIYAILLLPRLILSVDAG